MGVLMIAGLYWYTAGWNTTFMVVTTALLFFWYLLTQDSTSTGTNTKTTNTEATNTAANTNETSMTNTATSYYVDSRAAAMDILAAAQAVDPNAQLHYLTAVAEVNQVNNLDVYSHYSNGIYGSWAVIVYYPSTGMAVNGTWVNGVVMLDDPHPEASANLNDNSYNLNYLATSESSSVIFAAAMDAGLDPVNYYIEMGIMSSGLDGADPDWQVQEKSMTDVDEYGMSVVKGAVMVDPHTGVVVGN